MVSGGGGGHMIKFHIHMPHGGRRDSGNNIPKGCLAITVGQGEDQKRFVIPVMYVNHPLFMQLLKEAEEEYGFDQEGPINIPCHVEDFCHVRGIIDKETTSHHHHHHGHGHGHGDGGHHHNHHQFLCFKA